jgi:site-specific DNA-methyltransferase (adenine-specific)
MSQVLLGDAIELMKDIPDKSVDMILTDPPYGTIACKWDQIVDFTAMWKEFHRVIKPSGAMVITASQPFTTKLIASNIDNFKYSWIWNKKFAGNFCTAKSQPMKTHEDVCVFGLNKVNYYPQMVKRDKPIKGGGMSNTDILGETNFKALKKTYNEKYPITILDFPRELGRTIHPTQKPVALFEYLIKTYTNEGELVLDPFAGSGTTALAARNLNRNFIVIEKEQKYYDIILERLK